MGRKVEYANSSDKRGGEGRGGGQYGRKELKGEGRGRGRGEAGKK